jgi:hypothetical protein
MKFVERTFEILLFYILFPAMIISIILFLAQEAYADVKAYQEQRLKQVSESRAIELLKRRPNGAVVYECEKLQSRGLSCYRMRLTIINERKYSIKPR